MDERTRIVNALAEVVTLEDMAGSVLSGLQRIAGASSAVLFAFEREGPAPRPIGGPLASALASYTSDLSPEDVTHAYAHSFPPSAFLTFDRGDFDMRAHLSSRAYADFYRRYDIGCLMCLWPTGLPFGKQGMFGVLLTTPTVSRHFDPAARRALASLQEPMRAAARRIARYGELAGERDVLRSLVGSGDHAIVVWDSAGRLIWASPAAGALLGGDVPGDELARASSLARRQLARADAPPGSSVIGRPLRLTSAGGTLLAELSAIRSHDGPAWLVAELARDPSNHQGLAALTRAETAVLRRLAHGASNREIARELSVSEETVKTHVRHVLRKLDVSSRSKAASLAREAQPSIFGGKDGPSSCGMSTSEPLDTSCR